MIAPRISRSIALLCGLALVASIGAALALRETGDRKAPLQLIRIDDTSEQSQARLRRLVDRLDKEPRLSYRLSTVHANILSEEEMAATLASVPDLKGQVILAGSGLMALAAAKRFRESSILFASQLDPHILGLKSPESAARVSGFSLDVNIVPQMLSIIRRAGFDVRRVAVVADPYLIEPWRERTAAMRREQPEYEFDLFSISNEAQMRECLSAPDNRSIDAWIFFGTPALAKTFPWIKAELELRRAIGVYPTRGYVNDGGLMSYEARFPDPYGVWARQLVLLSQGVPAGDIPIEHPSNFELAINLDAANRIGLSFSTRVVKSATTVIDQGPQRPANRYP